jgi:hypothetical protein
LLIEIRNYHIDPGAFEVYKEWARTIAVPFLKRNYDVLGFWINSEEEPEVAKGKPDVLGTANVTWIVRWHDMSQRNEMLQRTTASPEWQEIFSKLPGGLKNYLRIESKFTEAL